MGPIQCLISLSRKPVRRWGAEFGSVNLANRKQGGGGAGCARQVGILPRAYRSRVSLRVRTLSSVTNR